MSNNRPLFAIAYHLLHRHQLVEHLSIDEEILCNFLSTIEDAYNSCNAYHNSTHGADVLQTLHNFLLHGPLKDQFNHVDILACLFSAIVHDMGHPGTNNSFLVNIGCPLALLYNDQSVLENYHVSAAFQVLRDPKCDILSSLSTQDFKHIRESVVKMVLGTDMQQHFPHLAKFKTLLGSMKSPIDFNQVEEKERGFVLQMALHVADVSNSSKIVSLSVRWAVNVMQEFAFQGDKERLVGLPVLSFMDRNLMEISKVQTGFIDVFIIPLFEAWHGFMGSDLDTVIENLKNNRACWEEEGDDLVNKVLGSPFDVKTTPTTKLPPRGQTHNEYISANGVTIPKNGLPLLTRLPGLELADLAVWSPPSLEDVARSTGRVLAT